MRLLIFEDPNSYKIIYSGFSGKPENDRKLLKILVGARGFKPPTSCSQSRFPLLAGIVCFQLLMIQRLRLLC